jgi:magnesium chelatase family protein
VYYEKLSGDQVGASPECIGTGVQVATDVQSNRFSMNDSSDMICSADTRIVEIRKFCNLLEEGQRLMRAATRQLNLLARAYHRILKLAGTIADLTESEEIQSVRLVAAGQYRPKLIMD